MRTMIIASSCALLALLAGCATNEQIGQAIQQVNKAFEAEYERTLAESGTRTVAVPQGHAFVALFAALNKLGMNVIDQDLDAGTLTLSAPAPRPLDAAEWRRAAEADTPKMQKLVCPIVGDLTCQMIKFEPYGLLIEINATVLSTGKDQSEVALTTRMREVAPDPRGLPRREYPPPTAVRMALDKIWAAFDRELGDRRPHSVSTPR
jgi:hypothetical protein